jgi:WD40 repeat protein
MQTTITVTGHTGRIRAVAWSPNNAHLATACDDGLIIFWSSQGRETTSIAMQNVFSLAWSYDLIAIGQVGSPTLVKLTGGHDVEKSEPPPQTT